MELPAQLVLCGLDSREQLLDTSIITHGQQRSRTISRLVSRAGAQVSNDFDVPVRDQMLAHLRLRNELVMSKTYVEFVADLGSLVTSVFECNMGVVECLHWCLWPLHRRIANMRSSSQ